MNSRRARFWALAAACYLFCGSALVRAGDLPAPAPAQATPAPAPAVATIHVVVEHDGLLADGRGQARFRVKILDARGAPLAQGSARVRTSGGTLLDAEGRPSTQVPFEIPVRDGEAAFRLLAPVVAGPVEVEVSTLGARALGRLDYLPAARQMMAIGVIDGVIAASHVRTGAITPAYLGDGFEQELQHWSRSLGGDLDARGRAAFFLKGTIRGDALLTAAYDSDKDTRLRLTQAIDPNQIYPVYGDDSIVGFEAQSASHLFVRVDKGHDYLLYGDFSNTGMGAAVSRPSLAAPSPTASILFANPAHDAAATAPDRVMLGRYNRTATGLRGHYQDDAVVADSFVIDDTLSQVVEEYPANGTSGPFAVRNSNAVQDSDRVEVIVRDRNQRSVIKSVTLLVRYVDYSFEPFSGRILLTQALPTITPAGDPNSLRITYEVDQGGGRFFTFGAGASAKLGAQTTVGVDAVEDRNPLSPSRLDSVNADFAPAPDVHVVAEAAHSSATLYTDNGNIYANPTGMAGETGGVQDGDAQRLEILAKLAGGDARLWWLKAGTGFYNPSSGVTPGREDAGARLRVPVAVRTEVYAEAEQSRDALTATGRDAARAGVVQKLSDQVRLDVSLRRIHDNSGFPAETQVGPNAAAPGAGGTVTGGFFGNGTSGATIDPLTGTPINALAPVGTTSTPASGRSLDATTVRAEMSWQASERWSADAAAETSINDEAQRRAELGASYRLTDKERAYLRAETQTGLASANSLLPADHSNSLVAGFTQALDDHRSVFSEYRMVDAVSATQPSSYDQMLANGLLDTRPLAQGITQTASVEAVKILTGSQREAVAAGYGLAFATNPQAKGNAKIEARRLFDDHTQVGDQTQTQWLATINYARRMDSDWTLLAKNYYLLQLNRDDPSGNRLGDVRQERFLTGFAWRPIGEHRVNALARYEYKVVADDSQPLGDHYDAQIAAATVDWHPQRALWLGGRIAAKHEIDTGLPTSASSFNAWLLGVRVTRDLGERFDLGAQGASLRQSGGVAAQSSFGAEAGVRAATDVWVSLGYNWTGFTDRDLAASDYTQRGVYLRLRAKFDESLLR